MLIKTKILYHMLSGMSRVFQYKTIVEVEEGKLKPQNQIKEATYINRPIVRVDEVRPLDHSLIHHPVGHHKGGVNYFYRPAKKPYWQPGIGIEGLMPYFIDTNVRLYFHRGSLKLDTILSRDTQLTNNF